MKDIWLRRSNERIYLELCKLGSVGEYEGSLYAEDVPNIKDTGLRKRYEGQVQRGEIKPYDAPISRDVAKRQAAAYGVALRELYGTEDMYTQNFSVREAIKILINMEGEIEESLYTNFVDADKTKRDMAELLDIRATIEHLSRKLFEQEGYKPINPVLLELIPDIKDEQFVWPLEYTVPFDDSGI